MRLRVMMAVLMPMLMLVLRMALVTMLLISSLNPIP